MDLGLNGRRALITGASRGLGLAVAAALASEGATTFLAARSGPDLDKAAARIGAAGYLEGDLADPSFPAAAVEAAAVAMNGLDILVANAGGPPSGAFADVAADGWDEGYQLTLMSFVRLATAALPYLGQAGQGRVLAITSISVREPLPHTLLGNTFRTALTAAAKTLAREVIPAGITVNTVQPGYIYTERVQADHSRKAGERGIGLAEVTAEAAAQIPAGRLGRADELGALCAFLCSAHSGYITGQSIAIDGGLLRSLQ